MSILVTGAAGFIGHALAQALLERGERVIGMDNLNDYYEVSLKQARLKTLAAYDGFKFAHLDLTDRQGMQQLFAAEKFKQVLHMAAQAGVRYSLENPYAYVDSNLLGFINLLECCRHANTVGHLVFASSSSVYGANKLMPFKVEHNVDHPLSLYAATKKANELMAHTYAHLYRLPITGLRFFTVYGPWGRPDMAPILFARKILAGETLDVFNHGNHKRDFTYIDDIVTGVLCALAQPAAPDSDWTPLQPNPASSDAPYRIYNIGSQNPVDLAYFIELLEAQLGRKADKRYVAMQPGDVESTYADISALQRDTGYTPCVNVETGVARFIAWFKDYYQK